MLCRDLLLSLAPAVHFAVNSSAGYVVANQDLLQEQPAPLRRTNQIFEGKPQDNRLFFSDKGHEFLIEEQMHRKQSSGPSEEGTALFLKE